MPEPEQAILLVFAEESQYELYFRFLRDGRGGWRFNSVQRAYIHSHPGRHSLERSLGKLLLRAAEQGVRGSNVDSEWETWFDLTAETFAPMFQFPVSGFERRVPGIEREFTAVLRPDDGEMRVVVMGRFSSPFKKTLAIWTAQARYAGLELKEVTPIAEPKIGKAEFTALVELETGPSNDDLIRYCLPALREIAAGGSNEEGEWLGWVLEKTGAESKRLMGR